MSTSTVPAAPLSDWVVSVLRTAVPSVWGALIAWVLTAVPLPHTAGVFLTSKSDVVAALAIVAWYAAWRRIEPHLPVWVTRLVLGSAHAPSYATVGAAVAPVLTNVVDKAITDAATQVPALAPVIPLLTNDLAKVTFTSTGSSNPASIPTPEPPKPAA